MYSPPAYPVTLSSKTLRFIFGPGDVNSSWDQQGRSASITVNHETDIPGKAGFIFGQLSVNVLFFQSLFHSWELCPESQSDPNCHFLKWVTPSSALNCEIPYAIARVRSTRAFCFWSTRIQKWVPEMMRHVMGSDRVCNFVILTWSAKTYRAPADHHSNRATAQIREPVTAHNSVLSQRPVLDISGSSQIMDCDGP